MATYDNPSLRTYTIPAAAIDTAVIFLSVVGPLGLTGRLMGIEAVVNVTTTGSDGLIQVGTVGAAAAYGTLTITAVTAPVAFNAFVDLTDADNLIAADTILEIASDGVLGAGDGDITVTIGWF